MKTGLRIVTGVLIYLALVSCANNPNKADKIETELEKSQQMGAGQMGLNDKDEMVFRRKVKLAGYLRDLQQEVYDLEAYIYGNSALGRPGQYGALRECRDYARSKNLKGDGKVSPMPKKLVLTIKEDPTITDILNKTRDGKIGVDEKKEVVAIADEYILDRIKRFESHKVNYLKQKDQFEEDLRICNADIKEKQFSAGDSSKVDSIKSEPIKVEELKVDEAGAQQ